MKFVVDASVAVKWFADEPLFDKARELQQHSLAAPDLIFAEVANVMWKLWRKGVLTDSHYAARGEALKDAPLVVTPVRDLLASAMAACARARPAGPRLFLSGAGGSGGLPGDHR